MIEGVGVIAAYVWLACAFLSAAVGQAKGRSGFAWLLGGLLFGLFALIAVAGMPTWREEIELAEWRAERREAQRNSRQERRLRPQTRESIA